MRRFIFPVLLLSVIPLPGRAGLYDSEETMADLPSQWRGFLLDHQTLRSLAAAPAAGNPANPLRAQYLKKADDLEKTRDKLSADQLADLGAIWVRLGRSDKAVDVLEKASR